MTTTKLTQFADILRDMAIVCEEIDNEMAQGRAPGVSASGVDLLAPSSQVLRLEVRLCYGGRRVGLDERDLRHLRELRQNNRMIDLIKYVRGAFGGTFPGLKETKDFVENGIGGLIDKRDPL